MTISEGIDMVTKSVRLTMTQAQYEECTARAQKAGFERIQDYVLAHLNLNNAHTGNLNKVLENIASIDRNIIGTLKELAGPAYWNTLPTGTRITLGTVFRRMVRSNQVSGVRITGRFENGHQVYEIIRNP
jgi:hypothetical protein